MTAALAVWRRDLQAAVPMLLCGAVLAFQILSYATGSTFAFLRFYVAVIPLAAMLVLLLPPARGFPPSRRLGRYADKPGIAAPTAPSRSARGSVGAAVAAAALVASLPVTTLGMSNQLMAVQEYALGAVLFPDPDNASARYADQARIAATFSTGRKLADYIDALHLPPGSVVMDTVYGFAVLVASDQPDRYVIPSDRDFVRVLNRPAERKVTYILAVPNSGRGTSDAVNRRYPSMYENGAQIATLELEIPNDGAGSPDWRLYRVIGS